MLKGYSRVITYEERLKRTIERFNLVSGQCVDNIDKIPHEPFNALISMDYKELVKPLLIEDYYSSKNASLSSLAKRYGLTKDAVKFMLDNHQNALLGQTSK